LSGGPVSCVPLTGAGSAIHHDEQEGTEMAVRDAATGRRRVRVWFGRHVIADYRAEADLAERYVAAMSRRFVGLRITNDPLPERDAGVGRPLPAARLWDVSPG
jgi:hypothetical protein